MNKSTAELSEQSSKCDIMMRLRPNIHFQKFIRLFAYLLEFYMSRRSFVVFLSTLQKQRTKITLLLVRIRRKILYH